MPKLKKSAEEIFYAALSGKIKERLETSFLTIKDLERITGNSTSTMYRRRTNPEGYTLKEIWNIALKCGWTEEDFYNVFRAMHERPQLSRGISIKKY